MLLNLDRHFNIRLALGNAQTGPWVPDATTIKHSLRIEVIKYFNRYTRRVETESIYGESSLRWIYGTPLGKLALHALAKRAVFSKFYGWLMNRPSSRKRIAPFIKRYHLQEAEFQRPANSFENFNEFFYRKLKPGARPIASVENAIIFPADGRHLAFQDYSACPGLVVKGQVFKLEELIQDSGLARTYASGSLLISRLCPVDYHRFHFPAAGLPGATFLIEGHLQSVSPIALAQRIRILSTNRRCRTELQTKQIGRVLTIEVGATCVGGFSYTFLPGQPVEKGDEKGFFRFGGSLTMTLFEPGRVRFDADLLDNSANLLETYARMGDQAGLRVG